MTVQLVGGLSEVDGKLQLLVRGVPVGPPPDVPLLWVVGDVGPQPKGIPLHSSLAQGDLKRRVLQAVLPVADVSFGGQTLRILPAALPWRGMSGASMSSPLNLVELVQRLSRLAAGSVVDLRFEGSGPPMRGEWMTLPEGADADRWHAFQRYSADRTAHFANGSLNGAVPVQPAQPGQIEIAGASAAHVAPPPMAAELPWQTPAKKPRAPWPVAPWLLLGFLGVFGSSTRLDQRLVALWVGACGLGALISGLRALSTLERLRAVPQAKVRSMALGAVELGGLVKGAAPFPSPHSGLLCAWLRWVIEEKSSDGRGQRQWRAVARGEITQLPFHLDDGTGKVLVQPAGAEVEVDVVVTPLEAGQRAREWMILEAGTVFVYGMAQRRAQLEERRARLQEYLRASKHDAVLRASLGLPAEGELSMDEWDRLREQVESSFNAQAIADDSRPDEVFVGASPSVPLLISQLSRQSELGRLRLRLWGGVLGGGSLLLMALLAGLR